jgi:hypothetical protein
LRLPPPASRRRAAVRFRVPLEKIVRSRADGFPERDDHIGRQEGVDTGQVPVVPGPDDEFKGRNLGDRPSLGSASRYSRAAGFPRETSIRTSLSSR